MERPLPVTVLTGSSREVVRARAQEALAAGAGRVAVVAPNALSPSKRQLRDLAGWNATTPSLARWGAGCSCCTVRSDVATKVRRLAAQQGTERVIVVLGAGDDLQTLAKTFTVPDERGRTLDDIARIDALVVAVEDGALADGQSGRPALVRRLELADVVLLADPSDEATAHMVSALNPSAHVERADGAALTGGFDVPSFDLRSAEVRASGALLFGGTEAAVAGSGFVRRGFREVIPFHPSRLAELLEAPWPGVVRAQGAFWVASRSSHVAVLDAVGDARSTRVGGVWWAAVPPGRRPQNKAFQQQMAAWHPALGDRCHELVIAGTPEGVDRLTQRLAACLLTDEELDEPEAWAAMPHPFAWPDAV